MKEEGVALQGEALYVLHVGTHISRVYRQLLFKGAVYATSTLLDGFVVKHTPVYTIKYISLWYVTIVNTSLIGS